jgi:UDP-2,3-diacylglucosamine pyrophosphatase LpxH
MAQNTSATTLFRQTTGAATDPVAFHPGPGGMSFSAPPPIPLPSSIDDSAPSAHDDDHPAPHRYRAIWLSDIHLGSSGCQANYLLDFLRHNESEYLYLVGDIIDGWQLKKGWYWPQAHNDVVQKVLRKARKGTHVVYIPGNHDEAVRQFTNLAFGDIHVREEVFHTTLAGKRLWVVHGDLFDGVIQHAKWLAYLGDSAYTVILVLNRWFNRIRSRLGFQYWSLSQYLKHQVKNAVNFISSFERVMTDEARRRGCDGVVCGHIHKAEIRDMDGLLYCNDGDWVESLSALVETLEGELRIVYWTVIQAPQAQGVTKKARVSA